MMTEEEFTAAFASERAKDNFDRAVVHLMELTDSDDLWRARAVVSGIAAYVTREVADRTVL
jgi:hypothetical protein